jgi:hypothetical protein
LRLIKGRIIKLLKFLSHSLLALQKIALEEVDVLQFSLLLSEKLVDDEFIELVP